MKPEVLMKGFPGQSERGFLGWSSVVLLRHEDRKILFDAGGFAERYVLLKKLAGLGIEPEDIDTLILSHFHFDHAVNFPLFPRAQVIMHEKELQYARTEFRSHLTIPFESLESLLRGDRLRLVKGEEALLPGLNTLEVPGHTPGCLALHVEGDEQYVLAGDAVKNLRELRTGTAEMSIDPEVSARSIEKIRAMGEIVIPGHDGPLRAGDKTITRLEKNSLTLSIPSDTGETRNPVRLEV